VSVEIHPTAIVAKGAELADGVSIGPYSIIGEHARIGARSKLLAHVMIEGHTRIGEDCTIRNFANLGGPPHHTAYKGDPNENPPTELINRRPEPGLGTRDHARRHRSGRRGHAGRQ